MRHIAFASLAWLACLLLATQPASAQTPRQTWGYAPATSDSTAPPSGAPRVLRRAAAMVAMAESDETRWNQLDPDDERSALGRMRSAQSKEILDQRTEFKEKLDEVPEDLLKEVRRRNSNYIVWLTEHLRG